MVAGIAFHIFIRVTSLPIGWYVENSLLSNDQLYSLFVTGEQTFAARCSFSPHQHIRCVCEISKEATCIETGVCIHTYTKCDEPKIVTTNRNENIVLMPNSTKDDRSRMIALKWSCLPSKNIRGKSITLLLIWIGSQCGIVCATMTSRSAICWTALPMCRLWSLSPPRRRQKRRMCWRCY